MTSLVILDNLSVNASRNKSHDLSAPLYHARNLRVRSVCFSSVKKKNGPVRCLLPCQGVKKRKKKDTFCADWAEKLAQSDKGSRSYYNIKDELLKQSSGQSSTESVSAPKGASRSKIHVEERDNDEAGETWQKLSGHSIIAGERLQETFDEAVTC